MCYENCTLSFAILELKDFYFNRHQICCRQEMLSLSTTIFLRLDGYKKDMVGGMKRWHRYVYVLVTSKLSQGMGMYFEVRRSLIY